MKKLLFALVLVTVMSTGLFAQRPDGWGIGVMAQYSMDWDGFHGSSSAAFSFKAPQLPIYWALNARFTNNYSRIGISGDYYLLEQSLVDDINFGWYLGLGGYLGLTSNGGTGVFFGARLPVGLYIMPVQEVPLEIFVELVPTLGIAIFDDTVDFPDGGMQFAIGIRFWL